MLIYILRGSNYRTYKLLPLTQSATTRITNITKQHICSADVHISGISGIIYREVTIPSRTNTSYVEQGCIITIVISQTVKIHTKKKSEAHH